MARVLVAEDDSDISRLIEFQLRMSGFEVMLTSDGAQAVRQARLERPDVVLLDWMMPVMDGLEAVLAFKSDPVLKPIPVILMTARAQGKDVEAGMAAGAVAYLIKPFPLEHLVSTIQEVLG